MPCRRILSWILVLCLILPLTSAALASEGELIVGYIAPYGSKVNPFLCTQRDLVSTGALIYESLFEFDADQKPQPVLAEAWIHEGKTWTVQIRSGLLFHNGVELVAQDVADSYRYFRNTAEATPFKGRLDLIKKVEVTDTLTLKITARYSGEITKYAMTWPVVQRNTASADVPMGTGPYWCVEYSENSRIILEANPYWWKQQPTVQRITFTHYWDTAGLLEALQTGAIDMMQSRASSAALTKQLSYCSSLDYPTATYEMLYPNTNGILADLNLRKAIMYAIDYNTLIQSAYLDMAQQCEVPVSPGSWVYETRSAVYYYSPERALQYLFDSGWQDLTGDNMLNKTENDVLTYIDLKILVYDDSTDNIRGNAADRICENLRAIGINASVEECTRGDVRKALNSNNYDLALIGVTLSEVPDLMPLLASDGNLNFSSKCTERLKNLLEATMSATTETDMKNSYSDLQLYIIEELPILGLCFRTGMLLSTVPTAGLTGTREFDVLNGIEFFVGR